MKTDILAFKAQTEKVSNTKEIQEAIDTVFQAGGGTVIVPSGVFHTGPINLKSNIELHLEPGAVLRFSDDPADFPSVNSRWEGASQKVYAPCIYAEKAENVAVTGFGTIDGNGKKWWQMFFTQSDQLAYPRPVVICFQNCRRVTIQEVRLINSPSWTVHPLLSEGVTIENITILNPADSPNTDGIDIESCRNVRISNCHIDVGDDCIAVKSGTEETTPRVICENITITNCTMVHGHGGIVFGSEMSGGIRNAVISNCIFQETDRGLRFKSYRDRGGVVEDVRVSGIVMDRVLCPFVINLHYCFGKKGKDKRSWDKAPYPADSGTPAFRRLHFSGVSARNVQTAAGFIHGLAEKYVSELSFDQIDISMADIAKPDVPAMMLGLEPMSGQGFFVTSAKDITFDRVTITNHEGAGFILESADDIDISRCASKNRAGEETLIVNR